MLLVFFICDSKHIPLREMGKFMVMYTTVMIISLPT